MSQFLMQIRVKFAGRPSPLRGDVNRIESLGDFAGSIDQRYSSPKQPPLHSA